MYVDVAKELEKQAMSVRQLSCWSRRDRRGGLYIYVARESLWTSSRRRTCRSRSVEMEIFSLHTGSTKMRIVDAEDGRAGFGTLTMECA
jgi:hypothetical protein